MYLWRHRATALPFFLVAVGYTVCWTAVCSLLALFAEAYGNDILLHLNVANFLPSIPLQLLTVPWHDTPGADAPPGAERWLWARLLVGLAGCGASSGVLAALAAPPLPASPAVLLAATAVQGACGGVALGASYALAALAASSAPTFALTVGYVASGPLVLLLEVAQRLGPQPTAGQVYALFALSAAGTLAGTVAAASLHARQRGWRAPYALDARRARSPLPYEGASQGGNPKPGEAAALLIPVMRRASSGSADSSDSAAWARSVQLPCVRAAPRGRGGSPAAATAPSGWAANQGLMRALAPAASSLALNVGTSVLVFPYFTYVESSGLLGALLPQALFGVRVVADIVGRLLPISPLLASRQRLVAASVAKLGAALLFLVHIALGRARPWWRSDVAALLFVAGFWTASGLLSAAAYVGAQAWAPPGSGGRAGGFMALAFQVACLVALLAAEAGQEAARALLVASGLPFV
ncbi:hypothetical protein WJX81_006206 [Elliptochloris bilobata]|uniref:Uncharacterized protein n=1 Tax=Elliptochloris bilobata TaxID=381761 RepID=A0AAW1SM06_9CHLO